MAQATGEPTPKQVPKRNDLKSSGLVRNSGQTELRDQDPDYAYANFSTDPESPAYIGKRLSRHFYGKGQTFGQWIEPWEACHSQTDADVRALEARTDAGAKIDTVLRGPGRQITCRIRKTEHEKYAETDRANSAERKRELSIPDAIRGQHSAVTTVVMQGDQDGIARQQALLDAGHPIPGIHRQ